MVSVSTLRRETKPPQRRIMLYMTVGAGSFFDLIAKYSRTKKRDLAATIWEAGMREVLGCTPDQLEGCRLSLPEVSVAVKDLRRLSAMLRGESPGE